MSKLDMTESGEMRTEFKDIIRLARSLDNSIESVESLYHYSLERLGIDIPEEKEFQKNGVLIAFDGHSGAGKDTQIRLLENHMIGDERYIQNKIMTLVQKKNPFKQVSKYLWQHPESEIGNDSSLLLLTAGRKYFTYNDLSPSLELDDSIIILNRSYLSNLAYHASCPERLPALMLLSYFDIPADIKLMLECDTAAAYTRIIARSLQKGGIIYPNEKPEYIDRVKKNFHELSKFVDGMIFIDSSGRQDEVSKHICSIVDDYFKEKR